MDGPTVKRLNVKRYLLVASVLFAWQPLWAGSNEPLTIDLGHGVSLELVRIEPGEFGMGRPATERGELDEVLHRVRITRPFWLGRFEITQEQWVTVTGANPSKFRNPKAPVDSVSWNDCQEFCRRLNQRIHGARFRLPTEAEWEYACRAGTRTRFSFGDDDALFDKYLWAQPNSGNETHPVGAKRPNPWGLFDMHGNVWEWCQDYYGRYEFTAGQMLVDPLQTHGMYRVLRGGAWNAEVRHCRSARRFCYPPGEVNAIFGFRVARDAE